MVIVAAISIVLSGCSNQPKEVSELSRNCEAGISADFFFAKTIQF
jgi:hypothetical protein